MRPPITPEEIAAAAHAIAVADGGLSESSKSPCSPCKPRGRDVGQSTLITANQLALLEVEVVLAGLARSSGAPIRALAEAKIIAAHHPDCEMTEKELAEAIGERPKHRGLTSRP